MGRKQFRIGLIVLLGLASYFLILSALLVAVADVPQGNIFAAGASMTSRTHRPKPTTNMRFDRVSSQPRAVFRSENAENALCLRAPTMCGSPILEEATDQWQASRESNQADSLAADDKPGSFHDPALGYHAPPDSNFFAFSPGAMSTPNGEPENGSTQNIGGTDGYAAAGSPDLGLVLASTDQSPESNFFPTVTGIPDQGPISQSGTDDPPSSSNPSPIHAVPEPSSFWLFLMGFGALVLSLRHALPPPPRI